MKDDGRQKESVCVCVCVCTHACVQAHRCIYVICPGVCLSVCVCADFGHELFLSFHCSQCCYSVQWHNVCVSLHRHGETHTDTSLNHPPTPSHIHTHTEQANQTGKC